MKKDTFAFIDHTADIMFKAEAATLEGLFVQGGLAIGEITTDLKDIEAKVKREITGKDKDIEMLFFDFLDDLLFYKDSELLIFSSFEVKITQEDNLYVLNCVAKGEALDANKHERKIDIKAITMHLFEVHQSEDERWHAQVLIDI